MRSRAGAQVLRAGQAEATWFFTHKGWGGGSVESGWRVTADDDENKDGGVHEGVG